MMRLLKQHLKPWIPGPVRGALKGRIASKFHPPVEMAIELGERNGAITCTVDGSFSFAAPSECRDDLVHFSTTPQGRSEFYAITKGARKGGTLFDVGAHSGLISALFCAANPRNRVYSFEPSPILFERLKAIRELNDFSDRMFLEQVGIGEVSATTEMLLDPAGGYIQAQRFEHTMWAAPETVQIRVERLADAAARLGVIPEFIKLDIESYEYEAIKGSLDFLADHKPTIFLEIHLDYLEQRNLSAQSMVEMLERSGYRFYSASGAPLEGRELYDSALQNIHLVAR
jgi:FkbM family methyltransferase